MSAYSMRLFVGAILSATPADQVSQAFSFSLSGAPMVLAARASVTIPFVYSPVEYGRAMLMDGGMINNTPVDKLTIDAVPLLGIQLVSKASPLAAGTHTLFDIAPSIIDLMLSAQENTHVDLGQQQGAAVAFIETGFANVLDRNMSPALRQQLFDNGHAGAKAALASLP
jgi:NTE family protein